jgi:CHAT domain-containing protein/tetratricopeptide (TPR) repeat protein
LGLAALVEAVGAHRLLEPRLTGGFVYGSCELNPVPGRLVAEPRCSPLPTSGTPAFRALNRAAAAVESAAERHPSPRTLHARAILALLGQGGNRALDRAVAELEEIGASGVASIQSDLAAALLLRAERQDEPYDLVQALEAADRAVASDPRLLEARFNRALIFEKLYLAEAARSAWRDFLRLDSHSGWAREAERRLLALSPPSPARAVVDSRALDEAALRGDRKTLSGLVAGVHQQAREHGENELLPSWGKAWLGGDRNAAARRLTQARTLGSVLADSGGDPILRDTVAVIDGAGERGDSARLWDLARGHDAFGEGYLLYKDYAVGSAEGKLDLARQALARGGSPLAFRASFFFACNEHHRELRERAFALLEQLRQKLGDRPYPTLHGHVAWMQGLLRLMLGDPARALGYYDRSIAAFESTGEGDNISSLHSLIAEAYDHLGRTRDAWKERYRALRDSARLRDPQLQFLAFAPIADSALKHGQLRIALYFQDEVVRVLAGSKAPVLLSDAFFWHGLILHHLGEHRRAQEDLRLAAYYLGQQADPDVRRRTEADIALIEGGIALDSDPRQAITLLSTALAEYRKGQLSPLSLLAYQARAQAFLLVGETARAEADLDAGLQLYEDTGERVDDKHLQLSFLHGTEEVFDQMISFQVDERRNPDRAFTYADRARTRALPELTSRLRLAPGVHGDAAGRRLLSLTEARRRLPRGTVLIQYSVLPGRVLLWRVRRDDVRFSVRPVSREKLADLASRLREGTERESWRNASSDLYDLLVRPWVADLDPGDTIVFIPDKELHAISFASLVDRTNGRYLVQDHRLCVAFSASLALGAKSPRRKERPFAVAGAFPALIVGGPAFDTRVFSGLQPLPGAAAEAGEIAKLYPTHLLLTGLEADRQTFSRLAGRYPVVHFAGHAVVNDREPLLSSLLLAPSPGGNDSGTLSAADVYRLELRDTRLVFLASCDTASSGSSRSEGLTSLARAFLSAGVPAVVASLRRVNDRSTQLSLVFHRTYLARHDPIDALRAAQLALLESGDPALRDPAAWGAFQVLVAGINGHS